MMLNRTLIISCIQADSLPRFSNVRARRSSTLQTLAEQTANTTKFLLDQMDSYHKKSHFGVFVSEKKMYSLCY